MTNCILPVYLCEQSVQTQWILLSSMKEAHSANVTTESPSASRTIVHPRPDPPANPARQLQQAYLPTSPKAADDSFDHRRPQLPIKRIRRPFIMFLYQFLLHSSTPIHITRISLQQRFQRQPSDLAHLLSGDIKNLRIQIITIHME